MSLIRRCHVTNFLDSSGGDEWEPSFEDVTLNFHCNSTAVVAENGLGKTKLITAMLAVLSRDHDFITITRNLMPPKKTGRPGHIRIEFLTESPGEGDLFLYDEQSGLSGEGAIFGMYGNRDTQMKFYHYLGRLEDVPTIRKFGENDRQLVSINEFKESIDDVEGIDELSLQDWIREISEYVPRSQVLQMVKFQKAGGLDNASSIFPVKLKGQDTYDQAFFYQIIAPELLSGFFEDNPKLQEKSFASGVIASATQIAAIQKKINGNLAKNKLLEGSLQGLKPAVDTANRVKGIEDEINKVKKEIVQNSAIFDYVEAAELPGIPARVLNPLTPELESLLSHMAIIPGKGVQLMDRGLAELLGKQVKHINRDSDNFKIVLMKSLQPIEIIMDHGGLCSQKRPQGGGKPNQFYDLNSILQFITKSSDEYLKNRDRKELCSLLTKAFEISEAVDTNPFRAKSKQRHTQIIGVQEDLEKTNTAITESKEKYDQDNRTFIDLQDAKNAYQLIDRKGLLRSIDLENKISPVDCREDLKKQRRIIEDSISGLNQEIGKLGKTKDELEAFLRTYPGEEPRPVYENFIENESKLNKEVEQADKAYKKFAGKRDEFDKQERLLSEALNDKRSRLQRIRGYKVASAGILDEFPGTNTPEDIEQTIDSKQQAIQDFKGEIQAFKTLLSKEEGLSTGIGDLEKSINQSDKVLIQYQAQNEFILEFEKTHPGISPQSFLDSVKEQVRVLGEKKKKLKEEKKQREEELHGLENKKISASLEINRAWSESIPNSAEKLWEVVQAVNPTNKALILKKMSSLLFCPIMEDRDEALKTAKRLIGQNISLPVFLKSDFIAWLNTGQVNGLLNAVVEFESEAVGLLLYPQRIEDRKKAVKGLIENIEKQIHESQKQIAGLSMDQPEQILADKANKAIIREIPKQIQDCQVKIQGYQKKLQDQQAILAGVQGKIHEAWSFLLKIVSDAAVASNLNPSISGLETINQYFVQRKEQFDKKYGRGTEFQKKFQNFKLFHQEGGAQVLADLDDEIATLSKKYEQAIKRLTDFDVKRDSFYKQFQEVDAALRSVGQKLSQFDFKSIIALAESGGIQRYQALGQQIEKLKSKRDKLEEYITNLPFHKAQRFYEQKKDFIELETALPELKKRIEDLSERTKKLESEIKTARDDLYQINEQEKDLDDIIFHIVQRIKDRKNIKIDVDETIEVDPDFQEMINNILQRQDFLNDMEFLKESLSQIDFSKLQKELDDKETVLDEQASYYGNHIDFVLQKEQTGLSDMEKDLIAQSKRQPGRIHGIHQSIESVINSTNDENVKFHEDIHQCEERAKERLLTAGESAGRNLRSFKQICRRYKDKATFHISTEIAAPEYIDAAIREVRQRVLKWIEAQESTDKDVLDQIHNDNQFVDEITNELYRGIFKTPSITVSHPDIRRGKRIPFCQSSDKKGQVGNEGLSVGQRVVLELMMLIRMAEYCAGSEDRQITKTFFLIDGMFSSVSKESLLEASLSALKDIRGSFQIIGFLHNIDYVNNPDLFPTELIARPYETFDLNNPDQKSCWVEFEERNQDKNGIGVFEITQGVLN